MGYVFKDFDNHCMSFTLSYIFIIIDRDVSLENGFTDIIFYFIDYNIPLYSFSCP